MLVMVVFFIAFRWIHLSTPLIRLFLLVLILLLMPTLNFLPVWFALSLLRFRLPSRLPMMFILWMVAMKVKDFLKVRCRLALLPFLISCLIWLDLVASLPLIKERILVIILLLHFLSLMLGSVLVLM